MHGREHTWVPTPAVLMAGGVMGMPSAGGMPKKVVRTFCGLVRAWGDPGPIARCTHLDRHLVISPGLPVPTRKHLSDLSHIVL